MRNLWEYNNKAVLSAGRTERNNMTIKEKAKRIKQYCDTLSICDRCPLFSYTDTCYDVTEGNENIIERNYNILFGDKESDNVNHPEHYQGKNECIDVMIAMFGVEAVKHFCMCNAYKYRFRADKKNGAEDIAKAEWYESKLIELNSKDK